MNLDGYIDVPTRLKIAAQRFHELRITEAPPVTVEVGGQTFIECKVTVWRSPDDTMPVVAYCWEEFPGRTPFTKGSEQPNGSTSAVGRALRWLMPDLDGPVASKDEVQNRRPSNQSFSGRPDREAVALRDEVDTEGPMERPRTTSTDAATDKQIGKLRGMMRARGVDNWTPPSTFTKADASQLIDELVAESNGAQ